MTPSEYKKIQAEKLKNQKLQVHPRISNNFIDNAIHKNNLNAIKTVFYIASILNEFDYSKKIDTLEIDLRKMFKYTNMNAQEVRANLKAMQETSITFINEKAEWEEHIVIIPRIEFLYGKNIVKIDIYSKIAKLIIDVKENYTPINTKNIMNLKSKYSVRLLPLLNTISRYDNEYEKVREFDLESINEFFGTRYKTFTDIKRKILEIAKEDLDNNSTLTFNYKMITEKLGQGRPKITSVKIKPISKSDYQSTIFSNFEEPESIQVQEPAPQPKEQSIKDEILEYIDIDIMTAGLPASIKKPQMQYLQERLQEFIEWVESVDNEMFNKLKKDWDKSFDRHISGYEKNFKKLDKRI